MTGQRRSVSRDTVFEVLSNSRRRFVLATLRQTDVPMGVSTLAREIGAYESELAPAEISAAEEKRIYVSLYQSHIPKLEAAGFVEYDEDERTVREGPAATEIDRYLDPIPPAISWPRLNGAVSLIAGIALLSTAADAVAGLSPYALGTGTVLLFLVLAVAQYADHRRRRTARPPELRNQ